MRMPVAEAVGRTLAELGVAHVFGVVGSGNFHVTNAIIHSGVPFVAARHEMGATCMADAYSRVTGEVAAVSVHQGCGLTNALTGIGEAAKSHTPLIVISGDTPSFETTSNFYIDQDAAVAAVGAVPFRVHRPATAVADTCRAFAEAVQGRRAVVLSLPLDIQRAEIDWEPASVSMPVPVLPAAPAPEAVRELAARLRAAERPVIIAGRGSRAAGPELRALAAASGALLATSAVARGLFRDDPWSLDVMGGFSTDPIAQVIADADVLVAFGAVLTRWTSRNGSLLRDKTVIQVDDRSDAIGSHARADLGVLGDAALVARAVTEVLGGDEPPVGYRTSAIADVLASSRTWREIAYEDRGDATHIDPRTLTIALDGLLPTERVIAVDGGNFVGYPAMFLRVPDERGFVLPLAFQSIGLSLASGVGAAIASPSRLSVVGVGDGAFMMSHVELDTAVRSGLAMVVIVYNDDAYGAEVQHFNTETDDLRTVVFPETDIAAIARGYGCDAITVRRPEDLAPVRAWLAGSPDRPLVIDAKIAAFPSWMNAHAMAGH